MGLCILATVLCVGALAHLINDGVKAQSNTIAKAETADRLSLQLEKCQTKLDDTENFDELSLIECEREIEYWKERALLRLVGCEDVLETMEEINTNIGCEEKLTTFQHGFYWERAQRKKVERQLEPGEEPHADTSDDGPP